MTPERKAEEIASLIGARLGIRGRSLEERVHRAGRLLPRRVRRDVQVLIEAEQAAGHPKLMKRIDPQTLDRAHRDCKRFLEKIDGSERMMRLTMGFVRTNAFNLLMVFALVVAVLVWRGYL